jgi:hypothetical protein
MTRKHHGCAQIAQALDVEPHRDGEARSPAREVFADRPPTLIAASGDSAGVMPALTTELSK